MAMRRARAAAIGLAVLAGAAGCAGGPTVVQADPGGVALRWYNWQSSFADAAALAQEHCRSSGRSAVLASEFTDRDVTRARFDCR